VNGDAAMEEAQQGSRCGVGGVECCKVKLERTRHKKEVFRQPCVVAGCAHERASSGVRSGWSAACDVRCILSNVGEGGRCGRAGLKPARETAVKDYLSSDSRGLAREPALRRV